MTASGFLHACDCICPAHQYGCLCRFDEAPPAATPTAIAVIAGIIRNIGNYDEVSILQNSTNYLPIANRQLFAHGATDSFSSVSGRIFELSCRKLSHVGGLIHVKRHSSPPSL